MPSFDSARNCHIVRIVYDGPGIAGKTTNLQRICDVIPSSRRSEMYTPAELKGRTMFFDWLEIDGPAQGGQALKFQLITVPGQVQRAYRRKPLIEMADVVTFVCDSSPTAIPETMRTFSRLRALMRRVTGETISLYKVGDLTMNLVSREVTRGTRKIELTAREFRLLEYLMRAPGQVLTRTQIIERVWEYHFDPGTNLVDVYIQRLRRKVDDEESVKMIQTVRGVGYCIRTD
jgi:hypothetical protein